MIAIDKTWKVALADGREVTVGAGVDEDRGVWLLSSAPLLRWLTADDTRRIAAALQQAAAHLEAHPVRPARTRRRR